MTFPKSKLKITVLNIFKLSLLQNMGTDFGT